MINHPYNSMCLSLGLLRVITYSYARYRKPNLLIDFLADVLEDYPDSPGGDGGISREAASHILDLEDTMDTSSTEPGCTPSGSGATPGGQKRSLL